MPARRVNVRKIREILRLSSESRLSQRQIASCCGISKTTVSEYLERAQRIGLDWCSASELSDEELERRLYPPAAKVLPNWVPADPRSPRSPERKRAVAEA